VLDFFGDSQVAVTSTHEASQVEHKKKKHSRQKRCGCGKDALSAKKPKLLSGY